MSANTLLDAVSHHMDCKNDRMLSALLDVAPPVISKLRHGRLNVGATLTLRIHELNPALFTIAGIRELVQA
ncbi:hypothetical protein ACHMW6_06225 [Pseudoduganella sp. UC29_106]|uniref:hypothetical protein n=1 Tax=Pseudoduganella sp. UC29_106 TaxID=3374553 RepID=UPI003756F08F